MRRVASWNWGSTENAGLKQQCCAGASTKGGAEVPLEMHADQSPAMFTICKTPLLNPGFAITPAVLELEGRQGYWHSTWGDSWTLLCIYLPEGLK